MNTLITAHGQRMNAGVIVAALLTTRSEEFRSHAAECHEIAGRCSDLVQEQYEALARQWLTVAEQVERKYQVAA
jgi:hypothetical protein